MGRNSQYVDFKGNTTVASIQERNDAILLIDDLKENINKKARAALAKAFLEDEASRRESFERSRAYLSEKAKQEEDTPFWVWALLYFVLGALFAVTADTVAWNWQDLMILFK